MIDAGLGRAIYVFAESSGERIGFVEKRQGTVDGGVGTGKGQTKKIPKRLGLQK